MRLAYLCNVYPAVSHSFVRREIEAVERAGHEVHRFTVRPPSGNLRDEADLREAAHTEIILERGIVKLLGSALILCAQRPRKTGLAVAMARRLSAPGVKSKFRHAAYWLEAAWLVRRLTKLHVEHLHVHFGTNPTAVAAIASAWGGPSFSFTAHGPDEFDAPIQLSLGAKVAAAKFVAAISSYGRSQLMRWSDTNHWNKIKVVRCGLGADFLDRPTTPVMEDSSEFVCVARLSAQKGLPLLLAACGSLKREGRHFTLTLVGDGELRSTLEEQVRREGLSDHVRLVGVKSSAEIRELLERARAFVLPSFAEGLPVVLMEALALGRPVITTAIAGIPELVDDQCGWLVPAASEAALIEAMKAVLSASAADLSSKAKIGRDRVIELHDVQRNSAHLLKLCVSDLQSERLSVSKAPNKQQETARGRARLDPT